MTGKKQLFLWAMLLSLPCFYLFPVSANNYMDAYPSTDNSTAGSETESESSGGFGDIEGHWAGEIIKTLSGMGLIGGVAEGVFDPDATMERCEFITAVVRQIYPTAEFFSGTYWYSGYYNTAVADGLLPITFREKNMTQPITRQEMAYIVVEALDRLGDSPTQLLSSKLISDFSSVTGSYEDHVLAAYSMGVVCGSDGVFSPLATATRGECAVILLNMAVEDRRAEVDFGQNPGAMTDMNRLDVSYTKTRENLTYSLTDSSRPIAKVGDIVIISGKEVTVEMHPTMASANGMSLPYVAGVALDLGIDTNSSFGVVKDGFSGGGIHYNGDTYYVNPKTGDGYWQSQWSALEIRIPAPRIYGTVDGESSTDAYQLWTWDAGNRKWVQSYLYGRT